MAEKQEEKVILERIYNVLLRKEWLKVPKHKRTKKAVKALKDFIIKHMKSKNINLGKELNEFLWKDGIRNPPHHVKVVALKYENNLVKVNLFGIKQEAKKEEKKEKTKEKKQKVKKEEKIEKKEEKTKDKQKESEKQD